MKATEVRQIAPLISLLLKLISGIFIIAFFVNAVVSVSLSTLLERSWQIGYVEKLPDLGVVPLVGLSFLLIALWMDQIGGGSSLRRGKPLALLAFLLSSLLGLIFLLAIPFHINNVLVEKDFAIKRIAQQATAAESQLDVQIQQQQAQISNLLDNPQQLSELDRLIKSGQVQGEQLAQLQRQQEELFKFRDNPENLKKQAKEVRNRNLTTIREERLKLEKQAASTSARSIWRTGLLSLLLAVAYIAIGWTGLKALG